jgi:hypothetical protein
MEVEIDLGKKDDDETEDEESGQSNDSSDEAGAIVYRELASDVKQDLKSVVETLRGQVAVAAANERAHERGLLAVGEAVLRQGAMRMKDATMLYRQHNDGMANDGRLNERIRKHLPVVMFTTPARKDGWMVMEMTDNTDSVVHRLLKSIGHAQHDRVRWSEKQVTREEFDGLETIMSAEEKTFVRFVLGRIYGAQKAKELFGIRNLAKVKRKVNAALERHQHELQGDADRVAVTPTTAAKRARKELANQRKGGRQPWEKDAATRAAFVHMTEEVRHALSAAPCFPRTC